MTVASALALGSTPAAALDIDQDLIESLHPSHVEHVDQHELMDLNSSDPFEAFITAFDLGDELFEVEFLIQDGGGANVGNGERTTRVPRADLWHWRSHTPKRSTGPNGMSCVECHSRPVADGEVPDQNRGCNDQNDGREHQLRKSEARLRLRGVAPGPQEESSGHWRLNLVLLEIRQTFAVQVNVGSERQGAAPR